MPMSSEPISAPTIVPIAAGEPRAADDDRGDDGEEIGLAERVAGAVQPAGIEQPGERRHDARQHHHGEADARDADADGARAPGIVADRVDMRAEAALAVEEMADRDDWRPSRSSSDGTPNSLPAPNRLLNVVVGDRHRLEVGQPARHAGEQAHGGERHQEGRQAQIGDQRAVDRCRSPRRRQARSRRRRTRTPSRSTMAASSAEIATIDPIDRSISPAVSTNTMPTAMTVTGAVCWTMLRRLRAVRNPSSRRTIEKPTRMMKKPT